MSYSGTTLSEKTGLMTRVFSAFGADISFLGGTGATGQTAPTLGKSCRGIRADGAGVLQLTGIDGVLVPLDVTAAGGSIAIDCAYDGVTAAGTTFVGQLVVVW